MRKCSRMISSRRCCSCSAVRSASVAMMGLAVAVVVAEGLCGRVSWEFWIPKRFWN